MERAELMHAGESWSPERCKGVAECSGRLEMLGWAVEASDSTNGTKVSGAGNLSCQSYLDEVDNEQRREIGAAQRERYRDRAVKRSKKGVVGRGGV